MRRNHVSLIAELADAVVGAVAEGLVLRRAAAAERKRFGRFDVVAPLPIDGAAGVVVHRAQAMKGRAGHPQGAILDDLDAQLPPFSENRVRERSRLRGWGGFGVPAGSGR